MPQLLEGERSSLCVLPGEMEKGGGWGSTDIPPPPRSSVSQDWGCKISQTQLKEDLRSLVVGPQPSILTSDASLKRRCFLAHDAVYF